MRCFKRRRRATACRRVRLAARLRQLLPPYQRAPEAVLRRRQHRLDSGQPRYSVRLNSSTNTHGFHQLQLQLQLPRWYLGLQQRGSNIHALSRQSRPSSRPPSNVAPRPRVPPHRRSQEQHSRPPRPPPAAPCGHCNRRRPLGHRLRAPRPSAPASARPRRGHAPHRSSRSSRPRKHHRSLRSYRPRKQLLLSRRRRRHSSSGSARFQAAAAMPAPPTPPRLPNDHDCCSISLSMTD